MKQYHKIAMQVIQPKYKYMRLWRWSFIAACYTTLKSNNIYYGKCPAGEKRWCFQGLWRLPRANSLFLIYKLSENEESTLDNLNPTKDDYNSKPARFVAILSLFFCIYLFSWQKSKMLIFSDFLS